MSNVESAAETGATQRGLIPWGGGTYKEVVFLDREGAAYTEGDIRIGNTRELLSKPASKLIPRGMGRIGEEYRWPKGEIPYQLDSKLRDDERIKEAIAHWQEHTPIQFIPRTGDNAQRYRNYLLFCSRDGSWSYVGMIGGEQPLSLGPEATTGNAIHEIGHAVGLWHEHSRIDRDKYIEIVVENIQADMRNQFAQQLMDGFDLGEYDYESVMHYPRLAFTKNGEDTIRPKKPNEDKRIGQRERLSKGDIAAVRALYL